MGKLKELWDKLKTLEEGDQRIPDIQLEINKIEQFCINKGYGGFTSITNWNNVKGTSPLYPWHTGFVFINDISLVGDLNGKGINYDKSGGIHKCGNCENNIT